MTVNVEVGKKRTRALPSGDLRGDPRARHDATRRGVGAVAVIGALCAGLGGLVTLAALVGAFAASPASAHTAGVPIPPQGDFMIRWHQPHGARPVANWDVEVTPVQNPSRRFIASAQAVPEFSCWALNVPVAEPAVVRVRSVIGTQFSAWTRPTVVPEPGLAAGLAAASGMLVFVADRSRSRASQSS